MSGDAYELKVDMWDWNDVHARARYKTFKVTIAEYSRYTVHY